MDGTSRRDILKIGSSGVIAGLAGCSNLSRSETSSEASKQDLRDRIAELEAELDELEQQESAAISRFSDEELEQARTVAKEVRKAVVTIGEDDRGGGDCVVP